MPSTGTDLELRARRVHEPAIIVQQAVSKALQSENVKVFYAIRTRVKPVKDVIDKVIRKRNNKKGAKPNYEPEDVTDVVGFRVVTLFREDLIEALRLLLQLIKHEGVYVSSSPFVRNELKESIVYTTARVGDPEAITSRLLTVFADAQFPLKESDIKEVATGYSSIHLIPWVKYDEFRKMPIEVQIRTVFEDAWGEVDHKLRYSFGRTKEFGSTDAFA